MIKNVALIGNPNAGKSTLFNQLTGLKQKVGNYPGVTIDKKMGTFKHEENNINIIDLPGIYSLYGTSDEEKVVTEFLQDKNDEFPDLYLVVLDATKLERSLLLYTQLHDKGLPLAVVINMQDLARKKGMAIDIAKLRDEIGDVPIIEIEAIHGEGIDDLKGLIAGYSYEGVKRPPFHESFGLDLSKPNEQIKDTNIRYRKIGKIIESVSKQENSSKDFSLKLDKILTHKLGSFVSLFLILFITFQAVFYLSAYPMDKIDQAFAWLQEMAANHLPGGIFFDLISEGVIPGLGGVVIFIPQIAILFFILGILEETGYMTRVVFIIDRIMRPFGLNGRSIVPLVSGFACAIPGIIASRTIESWKERFITILITPFMSCSARLPVYTIIIALIIPNQTVLGFISLKGITLFGLYFIGVIVAFITALILNWTFKTNTPSYLVLELPDYKTPHWKNVFFEVVEKCRVFVWNAGKIILTISVILWVLATNGPGNNFSDKEVEIQDSYIGIVGKSIEPAIKPLGYDWKIGIALITSFAAREVFVGTMGTIYGITDDSEDSLKLSDKMKKDTLPNGQPLFSFATGISLLLFYAFAMQCMSTFAIVRRETKSWKWPIIQLVFMTGFAYFISLVAYQVLS